jgi:hypothetical protein
MNADEDLLREVAQPKEGRDSKNLEIQKPMINAWVQ